jgi:hypothetical protein
MERDEWLRAASKVMIAERVKPQRLVFVDEMGANNLPFSSSCLVTARGAGTLLGSSQPWAEHHLLAR